MKGVWSQMMSIIREVTIRDVVFRVIKTTTVTQMRDVHIRDKIIKYCILLGSPFTLIKIRPPDAEWPKIWSVLAVPSLQLIQKF